MILKFHLREGEGAREVIKVGVVIGFGRVLVRALILVLFLTYGFGMFAIHCVYMILV